jgi:hypothetical protein
MNEQYTRFSSTEQPNGTESQTETFQRVAKENGWKTIARKEPTREEEDKHEREMKKLHDESEQELLEYFQNKKQNCFGCCGSNKPEIAIATYRVRREGYHQDEHGKAITDIWHEYFCDECYGEEYEEWVSNGDDLEVLAAITERN